MSASDIIRGASDVRRGASDIICLKTHAPALGLGAEELVEGLGAEELVEALAFSAHRCCGATEVGLAVGAPARLCGGKDKGVCSCLVCGSEFANMRKK